ncbi:MAG: PadR family transcriptional regulator [Anaerolineae bacterium]
MDRFLCRLSTRCSDCCTSDPWHGYELGRQLNSTVNAEWEVKPGQIASTLTRLKEANLVDYEVEAINDAPDRKVYFITDAGRAELETWYTTPEVRDYRLGDAFYIKLILSLIGGPVSPEQVPIIQRRELYQQLHEVTDMLRKIDPRAQLPGFCCRKRGYASGSRPCAGSRCAKALNRAQGIHATAADQDARATPAQAD